MAAAPTMVCFIKVDPTFQFVMYAISELQSKGRLQTVCTVEVGNDGLRSAAGNNQFGGRYGFARTLGSVLRAFMLRSAFVDYLHDPGADRESQRNNINLAAAGFNRTVQPPGVIWAQLPLTQNVVQAQEISANFDRLYPHFFIQNQLAEAGLDTDVSLPGMMVIVELQQGKVVKLHTINTTVSRAREEDGNTFRCPHPNVVRITAEVLGLQDGQTDDEFPHFKQLCDILEVEIMPDAEIEALLKKLRIEEVEEVKKAATKAAPKNPTKKQPPKGDDDK